MTETTYEMARRCSKCEQPGELISKRPAPRRPGIPRGAAIHIVQCVNERCKWYGTVCRIIQVNPDGSIPEPVLRREKEFPQIPDRTREVNDAFARQLELELQGGKTGSTAEIYRR